MGDPANLIGSTMRLTLYGGTYDLKIAGIFKPFNEIEKQYLRASGINNDEFGNIFLNGKFTQKYIADQTFFTPNGSRAYLVYFRSFRAMKAHYAALSESFGNAAVSYAEIDPDLRFLFVNLFVILFPAVLIITPVSLLFYFQMQRIEVFYNQQLFSVYDYLGYPYSEIRKCLMWGNLREIAVVIVKSLLLALPTMIIINLVNAKLVILPFQIFTISPLLILVLAALIVLLSILLSLRTIRHIRAVGWYQILLEQRDLL